MPKPGPLKIIAPLAILAGCVAMIWIWRMPDPTSKSGIASSAITTDTGANRLDPPSDAASLDEPSTPTTNIEAGNAGDGPLRVEADSPLRTVTLRILDSGTHEPVAGLRLGLYHPDGSEGYESTVTTRGSLGPAIGPEVVTAESGEAKVHLPTKTCSVRILDPFWYFIDPPWVTRDETDQVLLAARGGAVTGTVIGNSGSPKPGVSLRVDLFNLGGQAGVYEPAIMKRLATSGPHGGFALPSLPIQVPFTVEALIGSSVVAEQEVTLTDPGLAIRLEPITIPAVGSIRIHTEGSGRTHAQVQVGVDRGSSYLHPVLSEAEGTLEEGIVIDSIPVGMMQAVVSPQEHQRQHLPGIRVVEGQTSELLVRLVTGLTLRGTLRTRGGATLAGNVTVMQGGDVHPSALPDDDGEFIIGGLAPGEAMVFAHATGHATGDLTVEMTSPMGPVEILLDPVTSPMVLVTMRGEPMEGWVWIQRSEDYSDTAHESLDEEGRLSLFLLDTDPFELWVWSNDFSSGGHAAIHPADPSLVSYTIDLIPVLSATGSVRDATTGIPVNGARIIGVSTDGQSYTQRLSASATSDANGAFELRGLLSDERRFLIRHNAYKDELIYLRPNPGAHDLTPVLLDRLPIASGVVVDPNGLPIDASQVEIHSSGKSVGYRGHEELPQHLQRRARSVESSKTDADGGFAIPLPLGTRFQIKVFPPKERRDVSMAEHPLPPERRDHPSLRIELPNARSVGGQIVGVVVDVAQFGVDRVIVRPFNPRQSHLSNGDAVVGPDGRFEVLGLADGHYLVTAEAASRVVAATEATVENSDAVLCQMRTGRAKLRVRLIENDSGQGMANQKFHVVVLLGVRTGPSSGIVRYTNDQGELELEVPSGLLHEVFLGSLDESESQTEEFTALPGEIQEVVLTIDTAPR